MADFEEFSFDDSKMIASLQNILKLSKDIGAANEEVSEEMKKAYSEIGGAVADVEAEMKALQDDMKKHQAEARKSRQENVELKKSFGDLVGDVKVFGISMKGTIAQLQGKAQAIRGVVTGVGAASKAFNILKLAIISTGIGALVVLLGSLVAWFTKTQKGVDTVSKVLAGLGAVINVITDRITKVGGAIVKVFSGDFKGAFKDAKDAVSGLNEELKKEIALAVELETRVQKLRDAKRDLGVETAESRKRIKELNLTVEDTTKAIKDRLAAAEESGTIEKNLLEKRLAAEKEELQILLDKQKIRNEDNILAADSDEVAQARIQLANTEAESLELQTTIQNKKNGLLTEQAAKIKEAVEAQKALRKELEEEVKTFTDAADEIRRGQLEPAERIKAEEALAIALIEKQFKLLQEKAKKAKVEIDIEDDKEAIIRQIQVESYRKQLAEFQKFTDEFSKRRMAQLEEAIKLGELEADAIITRAKRASDADKDIRNIKPVVAPALDLSSFDILKGKIKIALGFGSDEEGEEQFAQFAQAIQQTLGSVFDAISTRLNSQIEENQAWIDDIREKQGELEEIIDLEKQRRDEGLAHNLTGKEEELAELKKKEEQALKEQAELRKKAASLQLIQDSATQISSLATAAAGIIKGFAEVPILGVALGIAAVASMFAFFASAKAKSREAARGYEGGFLGDLLGPNASSEDEPHRGRGTHIHPDLIANAREYLVNGDSTMANFDHLEKLNSGKYDKVDLDGILSQMSADELSRGFSRRQGLMDGFSGVNAVRMIRHTVRGELGGHTAALIKTIMNKPEHIAVPPNSTIRTYQGMDIIDTKPA